MARKQLSRPQSANPQAIAIGTNTNQNYIYNLSPKRGQGQGGLNIQRFPVAKPSSSYKQPTTMALSGQGIGHVGPEILDI